MTDIEKVKDFMKSLPKWKKGVPPHKGWWLVKRITRRGRVIITCESWVDDDWPYEFEYNVFYMDMNELDVLPVED